MASFTRRMAAASASASMIRACFCRPPENAGFLSFCHQDLALLLPLCLEDLFPALPVPPASAFPWRF